MDDGFALFTAGRFRDAIDAYSAEFAVTRSPLVLANRGLAYARLGEYQRAIADYQAADAADPPHLQGDAYPKRVGVVLWLMGRTADAVDTWAAVVDRVSARAYAFTDAAGGVQAGALLFYGASRLGDEARLKVARTLLGARATARAEVWPKPIAHLLLEQWPFPDVRAVAASAEPLADRRLCQAHFYAGVRARARGDEDARHHFTQALRHGAMAPIDIEYDLAMHESR